MLPNPLPLKVLELLKEESHGRSDDDKEENDLFCEMVGGGNGVRSICSPMFSP